MVESKLYLVLARFVMDDVVVLATTSEDEARALASDVLGVEDKGKHLASKVYGVHSSRPVCASALLVLTDGVPTELETIGYPEDEEENNDRAADVGADPGTTQRPGGAETEVPGHDRGEVPAQASTGLRHGQV